MRFKVTLLNTPMIMNVILKTRENKNAIIKAKTKVELLYIFHFLTMWIGFGTASIFAVISHGFYLKMKIMCVHWARYSYGEVIAGF